MAEAYATFAARGLHCDARAIVSISDREGKQLPVPGGPCSQVLDRAVADGVNTLLAGVIDGPVRRPHRRGDVARPPGRRQDRHHQRQRRRVVRGLHP